MLDDLTQGNGGRHVNLQLMIYGRAADMAAICCTDWYLA
jgi:hypothetical protein